MPVVVLLGGGHASGKHTAEKMVCLEIIHRKLGNVTTIDMNDYKIKADHCKADLLKNNNDDNNDDDDAEVAVDKSTSLGRFGPGIYDYQAMIDKIESIQENNLIVIVVGLYALYNKKVRQMADISVFIDSDPDTRLIRWIRRDVEKSSLQSILDQYLGGSRQEMNDHILPTKAYADVIMPNGPEPSSVSLVVDGIEPLFQHVTHGIKKGNILRPAAEKFDKEKGQYFQLN